MKGDIVIVRSFGDKPLVRRVWEVTSEIVFICSEENYNVLSSGKEGLLPVGFPREYVYRYNPKMNTSNQISWDKLTVYEN
jgi:hypothetical protein